MTQVSNILYPGLNHSEQDSTRATEATELLGQGPRKKRKKKKKSICFLWYLENVCKGFFLMKLCNFTMYLYKVSFICLFFFFFWVVGPHKSDFMLCLFVYLFVLFFFCLFYAVRCQIQAINLPLPLVPSLPVYPACLFVLGGFAMLTRLVLISFLCSGRHWICDSPASTPGAGITGQPHRLSSHGFKC